MKISTSPRRKIVSALMGLSLIGSSLVAASPVSAASYEANMTTPSNTIANGSDFTVTINAAVSDPVRGYEFAVNFDHTKLQVNSVSPAPFFPPGPGTFLGDWVVAHPGVVAAPATPYTIDNLGGHVTDISYYLQGGTGGPSGSGVLATVSFHAAADVNAATDITLSFIRFDDNVGTSVPLTMVIGSVPQPDLTVSNVVATGVAGDLANYNVSFRVNNIGNLDAGASSARIVVDSTGTTVDIAVPAIAQGTFATITTASPIAISGTVDNLVITADSGAVVAESNEGNNAANGVYSYVPASGQTTNVTGSIDPTLTFTQPVNASFGTLHLGDNTVATSMNVLSNQSWSVTTNGNSPTTAGGTDGKMTKFNTATGTYTPSVKLHNALNVQAGPGTLGVGGNVNLTGAEQTLATGIAEGQDPDGITGETRGVSFNQVMTGADAALTAGNVYFITVSFTAYTTAY